MRSFLASVLVLGVVAACSSGTTSVSVSDYDQSCKASDECVAVVDGDVCGCACANAAINVADQPRYRADVSDRRSHCPPLNASCVMCPLLRLECVAGRCTATRADAGAGDAGADGG